MRSVRPILYELGLKAAIEWLAERMSAEHGIACRCDRFDAPSDLPESARVLLFQIVRELLVNIRKHAHATVASVRADNDGRILNIEVTDNGVGLPANLAAQTSHQGAYGLFSIRERVGQFGGRFDMQSQPGKGVTVHVAIPLSALGLNPAER